MNTIMKVKKFLSRDGYAELVELLIYVIAVIYFIVLGANGKLTSLAFTVSRYLDKLLF